MNIKDLAYFTELVKERNYTVVANHFGVSQPTITYAVKRLEEELQTELLTRNRSHNALQITRSGQQLAVHSQRILAEIELAKTEIAADQQEQINFGLPPIIGSYFFPKLTQRILRHHLLDKIRTTENGSEELLDELRTAKLDLAILGSLMPLADRDLTADILATHHFNIIVSPDSKWANYEKIKFADLADEDFIMHAEGFVHPQAFAQLSQANGIQPHVVFRSTDLNILKQLILEQTGIGFLTDIAVNEQDKVISIPLADKNQPEFLISLVQRRNQILSPLQISLKGIIIGE